VTCRTIYGLRSVVFKDGELDHFTHTPNNDRYCWKEMVLWLHETTITTNFDVLLTVHLSIILIINQINAQILVL